MRNIDAEAAKRVIRHPLTTSPGFDGTIKSKGKLDDGRFITILHSPIVKNSTTIITGYYDN